MRFNLLEDIWKSNGEYAPKEDSKFKRLQRKPLNKLTVEEIKYLYIIDRAWYMSDFPHETIDDAYKAFIGEDELSKGWYDSLFEDAYNYFSRLSFPLTIYRAVRVGGYRDSEIPSEESSIEELKIGGNSRSWTTSINIYKKENSKFKKLTKIVAAEISYDMVDNAATISNYIFYTAESNVNPKYVSYGEYEITLKNRFRVSDLHNLRFVNKNEIKESFRKNLNEMILRESRGDTTLRQCLCSVLNLFCGTDINYLDTVIHHKNGIHDDNDIDNLVIFRKTPTNKNANTSIHARHRRGDFINFNSSNPDYTDNLYDLKGIDVWKSLNYGRLVSTNGRAV